MNLKPNADLQTDFEAETKFYT